MGSPKNVLWGDMPDLFSRVWGRCSGTIRSAFLSLAANTCPCVFSCPHGCDILDRCTLGLSARVPGILCRPMAGYVLSSRVLRNHMFLLFAFFHLASSTLLACEVQLPILSAACQMQRQVGRRLGHRGGWVGTAQSETAQAMRTHPKIP